MQLLNAPPRDAMSAAQVKKLLTGPVVAVAAGAERLDRALNVLEDISADLASAAVTWDNAATVHRDCKVTIARTLAWATELVRLYVTLTDAGGISARFNTGVFVLTTPAQPIGPSPTPYDVQGYDRLYLLNRAVGDSVSYAAGTGVITAVNATIAAAGLTGALIDSTADTKTLPADMVWPLLPSGGGEAPTWLSIVNQLLASIGYDNLWCDENGYFRSEPYLDPAHRSAEETFNVDDLTSNIVAEDRTVTADQWNQPNKWIFIQQNRASGAANPTEGDGIYTVDRSAGSPYAWVKQTTLDAADQASLVAQGDATVAADTRSTLTVSLTTGIWPVAGHRDVYAYSDTAAGGAKKVLATHWSMTLDDADMTWDWEVAA